MNNKAHFNNFTDGMSSGMQSNISHMTPSGMTSGMQSNISHMTPSGMTSGMQSGMSRMSHMTPSGMTSGMQSGMSRMSHMTSNGIPSNMSNLSFRKLNFKAKTMFILLLWVSFTLGLYYGVFKSYDDNRIKINKRRGFSNKMKERMMLVGVSSLIGLICVIFLYTLFPVVLRKYQEGY